MSAQPSYQYTTVDEYFELEDQSEYKNEYFDGEIFAMVGASINHNRIVRNLIVLLDNHLNGKTSEVFPSDVKVFCEKLRSFTYPDVSVVCEPLEFYAERKDTILNPAIIFEVLSDSTEITDRTKKLFRYINIPSIKEYVLVSTKEMFAEKYEKVNNEWVFKTISAEEILNLSSINLSLPLKDVYRTVEF